MSNAELATIVIFAVGGPLIFLCAILSLVVVGEWRRRRRTETDDDDWR